MIVEKPVQVASNQGIVLPGSKSKLDNIDLSNMNDSETIKKIQTIILNT